MIDSNAERGTTSQADDGLERAIGSWGLGLNAINGAVGAGIFVLPGIVAGILGPAGIIAYLTCGLAVALVLTCYIEIGTIVSRSGGTVAYIEEAFGPLMGFLAWLLYSIGFVIVASAALGNVFIDSAASVFPIIGHGAPRVIALAVLFGGLATLNILGVRKGMSFAVTATVAKLFPLLLIIVGGAIVMRWNELRWTGLPPVAKIGEASLVLFFAFQGAELALTPSGEIRDPARTVPRAMFASTAALIVLYAALQEVSQGVLGSELSQTGTPLAGVAGRIFGAAGHSLILVGTAVSVVGALAAAVVAVPRAFFLVAQDGMLPAPLATVHSRFHTPHIAIATVTVMIFLLAGDPFQCFDSMRISGSLPWSAKDTVYAKDETEGIPSAWRPLNRGYGKPDGDLAAFAFGTARGVCTGFSVGRRVRVLFTAATYVL
jgi:APA family basic amino acid/polyamine antiporter